uniref:Uncharacterized protein n=1 Tax=Anopheles culicifacies TaxID=139723 RepID=A0A182MP21_9DIPT
MHAALVYVCFGALVTLCGGNGATHQQHEPPDVNVSVAKVIGAMVTDGERNDTALPLPEHHSDRGQRIVARKGVINDVAMAVKDSATDQQTSAGADGASAPSNTTHKAPATQTNVTTTSTSVVSSASHGSTIPTISANAFSTTSSSAKPSSPPQSKSPSSTNATTVQQTSATSSSSITSSSSTTTTTTTTTTTKTTSTTSTTSTTTKPPKKPKITYSIEDEPKLLQAAKPGYGTPYDPVDSSGRLRVDEPLAQFSQEFLPSGLGGGGPGDPPNSRREYIVPIVTLIFAIPLLLGLFLLSYRRAKEFWLTRHYRRMDFLIDGMYNY